MNTAYNNHMQIVQTAEHVVIVTEMNHDARIRSCPRTWCSWAVAKPLA